MIRRGEVHLVQLSGSVGHETDTKRRPAAVVSINDLNVKPLVVTVVPGTTAAPKGHVNEVFVKASRRNGLLHDTVFLCHQLRALDHSRFVRRLGMIEAHSLLRIEAAIKYSLGLSI